MRLESRTLVVDCYLPLVSGTPEQRRAAALRDALGGPERVVFLTVDIHGTQWWNRSRMLRGDLLQPNSRKTRRRPRDTIEAVPGNQQILAVLAGPAGLRRARRIGELIRKNEIGKIVVADPLLLSTLTPAVLDQIVGAGLTIEHLDPGLAAWSAEVVSRADVPLQTNWHDSLARNAFSGVGAALPFDLVPPVPDPETFLAKGEHVVLAGTGLPWLDGPALDKAAAILAGFRNVEGASLKIWAFGFAPALVAKRLPEAEAQLSWTTWIALAGSAAVFWAPWLPPALARLAEALLQLGTPLLTSPAEAAFWGLEKRPGVYAPQEGRETALLAALLDPQEMPESRLRDISAAAVAESRARLQRLLKAFDYDTRPPATGPGPVAVRPLRVSPLWGPAEVIYNPASRMILLRLPMIGAAEIDEVRLSREDGSQLMLLMPTAHQRRLERFILEGGVVLTLEALGPALQLEFISPEGSSHRIRIPQESFSRAEAEITACQLDGPMVAGSFWLDGNIDPAKVEVDTGIGRFAASRTSPAILPEIGVRALQFRVPRPRDKSPFTIRILQTDRIGGSRPLVQRPCSFSNVLQPVPPNAPIEGLRNLHRGRRGWIVGNGPSVRLEDLARIPAGDIVFCFNRFYLSYGDHPLREDYVVSADTLMIEDFGQEMIDIAAGRPLFAIGLVKVKHLTGDFVYLPPGNNYLPLFSNELARSVSIGGSSVFVALQVALHMGLRDLVLYGLDYSFSMNLRRDPRYPFPVSMNDNNHFIRAYRSAKPWVPPNWRDISAGFLSARIACEVAGVRIRNATRGGLLETFERANVDTLLAPTPERDGSIPRR